jgi:multicomponent Na+:H+ antiporter subunit G
MSVVAIVLILAGSTFCLLAAVGLLRFPDLYTRLHASAKAGPLGAGLILLGVAVASADVLVVVRSVVGLVFLIVVSPLSGHLLARAALLRGSSAANITSIKSIDDSRKG